MPGEYFVSGPNGDELHEQPETPGGPTRLVAQFLIPENRGNRANIAQALAEALNAIEVIEAQIASIPAGPAKIRLQSALTNVRRVPRP